MAKSKKKERIRELFNNEYLTPKEISLKTGISLRMVYRHIQQMKQEGIMYTKSTQEGGVSHKKYTLDTPEGQNYRLHGQQFRIKILFKRRSFGKHPEGSMIEFRDNLLRVWGRVVEVYSRKEFFGVTPSDAYKESLEYWLPFFRAVESSLGVVLVKERYENIVEVKAHIAHIDDPLAKECLREDNLIRVVGSDGRVWLLVDNSKGFEELEVVHPERHKLDLDEVVVPFFNDLRDGFSEPFKPSVLANTMVGVGEYMKKSFELQGASSLQIKALSMALEGMSYNISTVVDLLKAFNQKGFPGMPDNDKGSPGMPENSEDSGVPDYVG